MGNVPVGSVLTWATQGYSIPWGAWLKTKPHHKRAHASFAKVPSVLAGVSSLCSATSVSFKQGAVNLSWQRQQCGKVLVLHAHSPYAAPHPSKWEGIWGQLWEILQGCDVSAFPNSFFFLL